MGLTSYNYYDHVPSDIRIDHAYLDSRKTKSQQYLDNLSEWTANQEMELNLDKSKYMIFNFTKDYAFSTRLHLNGVQINQVKETKLLGVILRDDLSWKSNTEHIIKKAYKRMIILKRLYQFGIPRQDLTEIYILYIRSVLEQSSVIWHGALTVGETKDIERVQKVALRLILKEDYTSYKASLQITGLLTLEDRRKFLCLNFAKKCLKSDATKDMFPLKKIIRDTRKPQIYKVPFARTSRFANSAIPYMARLLNNQT